jgi:Zn-dependent protease
MNGNFTLGRVGGIELRINWSWLVVFALIVWSLAAGVFPSQNPGLSDGGYAAMAVAAAFLFFASLLLHELGHARQALREGMEIDGITLWLFGGVAQFKGSFPSAGAEFRIAIAGPLVSLGLGVGFVLLALAGLPSAVDGVVAWLGYINLALLVFNLIPALPLDGAASSARRSGSSEAISGGRRGSPPTSARASATCSSRSESRCSSSRDRSAERGSPSSAGSCSRLRGRRRGTSRRRRRSTGCASAI